MKKLATLLSIVITVVTASYGFGVDDDKSTYNVNTKASKVYWTGKKVTGEHTGHLNISNGEVYVMGDKVVGGNLNLDLNSIDCTDLSGQWKDRLVDHLKSDDFFSVEKHPVSTFKITAIKSSDSGHQVVGDLTIKGITNEISFPAEVSVSEDLVKASGTASLDRTKWDIKFRSGKFFSDLGDNMIDDEFQIKFELEATAAEELTSSVN